MIFVRILAFLSLLISGSRAGHLCSLSSRVDLQLIVDSSSSIGQDNFRTMMKSIADELIDKLDVGIDKTRVALFKFSAELKEEFNLDRIRYMTKESLKEKIKATKYKEGPAWTGSAMEKALASYVKRMRSDKMTQRVCMVFIDGAPSSEQQRVKEKAMSKKWADLGAKVFAIGLGPRAYKSDALEIAGVADQARKVDSFASAGDTAAELLESLCKPRANNIDLIQADFSHGTPGSTSHLAEHPASHAFVKQQVGDFPWVDSLNVDLPQTVYFKFDHAVSVEKFSFSTPIDCCEDHWPVEFEFVGSDDCKTWTTMMSVKTHFKRAAEEMTWEIPEEHLRNFKCCGVRVKKVELGDVVAIQNLKMWRLKEYETTAVAFSGSAYDDGHYSWYAATYAFGQNSYPWISNPSDQWPKTLWYKFSSPKTVTTFAFSSHASDWAQQSPTEFEFIGSNDCQNADDSWKVLTRVKTVFTAASQTQEFRVPPGRAERFYCYGLRVLKVTAGKTVTVRYLRMWEVKHSAVEIEHGMSGSTSHLYKHEASNAFDSKSELPWSNDPCEKMPQIIWYKFDYPHSIDSFGFSSRNEKVYLYQTPVEFYFVGSDDCKTWQRLSHHEATWTANDEAQTFSVPMRNVRERRCYGVEVLRAEAGPLAALQKIKMWSVDKVNSG